MAPTTGDVLRRSFDNAIANWEAVLLEIGVQIIVTVAITLGGLGALMPLIMGNVEASRPPDRSAIVTIAIAVIAGVAVWTIVTSFPAAASTRLYIDGERAAAAAPLRSRQAYRVFAFPAWLAAGRTMWARVFGIQVVAASIAIIVVGIPVLVLFSLREWSNTCAGCGMFIIIVPLLFATIVMATLCSRKAVVIAVGSNAGVEDALGMAWRTVIGEFGAHLLPVLAIGVMTIVASLVLGIATHGADALTGSTGIAGQIANGVAASCGSCWLRAAFVSLTESR
jgi:hypothetical protein